MAKCIYEWPNLEVNLLVQLTNKRLNKSTIKQLNK